MRKIVQLIVVLAILLSLSTGNTFNDTHYTCKCNKDTDTLNVRGYKASIAVMSRLNDMYIVPPGVGLNESGKVVIRNTGNISFNVSVVAAISPQDPSGNLKVDLDPTYFSLSPGEEKEVLVRIYVDPDIVPGASYNITLYAKARNEANKGNIIEVMGATSPTVIIVGEQSYRLTVILNQPDGSPTYGTIKIYYSYHNKYAPIYNILAHKYTFYVIEGKYLVEAYFAGGTKVTKEVEVNSDMTLELKASTIRIEEIFTVSEPRTPYDSYIFRADIINDDPLIYKKTISVVARLTFNGKIVADNISIADLTIRSRVRKSVIGFIPAPEDGWENGTYTLTLLIICRGVTLFNRTEQVNFRVYAPREVERVSELPFIYLLLTAILGILFGFIGAKLGIRRLGREYLPKAVGLIYGGRIVAYNIWEREFSRPELISGEWQKIVYGFNVLSKRYWRKKEKQFPIVLSLNSEKWIFIPLKAGVGYFICVHAALNEFDIREQLARLKVYFEKKLDQYGAKGIFNMPEEVLSDIYDKIKDLFG